jgi:hypothetical protein
LCTKLIFQDVKTLKLTPNSSKESPVGGTSAERATFVCPLTLKEMNGSQPFVYLWTCGCVFSQAGLRAVAGTPPLREDIGKLEKKDSEETEKSSSDLDMCPQCGAKYSRTDDIITLNPPPEEELKMFDAMLKRRAVEPKTKGKKRKAVTAADGDAASEPSVKKKHTSASPAPSINANIATASRAVAQSLAQEEAKRKANMSDAVKSLYGPKNGAKPKEMFMIGGTFTRVS